eukprot:1660436-Amphidinium_carterae.3
MACSVGGHVCAYLVCWGAARQHHACNRQEALLHTPVLEAIGEELCAGARLAIVSRVGAPSERN